MPKHHHAEKHPWDPEEEINDVRVPYWQRAHRDWRFLAVVVLMLAAMATYIMTGNLAWRPRGQALPLLDADGK
jgi:hypothetical protein